MKLLQLGGVFKTLPNFFYKNRSGRSVIFVFKGEIYIENLIKQ